MVKLKTNFVGGTFQHRSIAVDGQECVNLYPEIENPGAKEVSALIGTPGLSLYVTASNAGKCRGLYDTAGGRHFSVNGQSLYEVVSGVITERGGLNTFTGSCTFADDGTRMIIADGTYCYCYVLATNAMTRVNESGFIGGSHVVFVDQMFVVNRRNTNEFAYSEIAYVADIDGYIWNPANYFTAENFPDNISAILRMSNEIWIFGSKSVEIWYDTGNSDVQFARVRSGVLNIGTAAPGSCATNGTAMFWLGSNDQGHEQVFTNVGYQSQRISTYAIEYLITQLSSQSDAVGYCYQQEGHSFYVLHFPTADKTICYDTTTGMWHTRTTYDTTGNKAGMWRGLYHAVWAGKNYVGDFAGGNIYEVKLDCYLDNSALIQRIRTTPHITKDGNRIFFGTFEIDIEKGVGLDGVSTTQGADPKAMLQWSDDGGFTWSTEYWADMGKIGTYLMRVRWNRLGCSRDRMFRVTITDPVRVVITGATMTAEVEGG